MVSILVLTPAVTFGSVLTGWRLFFASLVAKRNLSYNMQSTKHKQGSRINLKKRYTCCNFLLSKFMLLALYFALLVLLLVVIIVIIAIFRLNPITSCHSLSSNIAISLVTLSLAFLFLLLMLIPLVLNFAATLVMIARQRKDSCCLTTRLVIRIVFRDFYFMGLSHLITIIVYFVCGGLVIIIAYGQPRNPGALIFPGNYMFAFAMIFDKILNIVMPGICTYSKKTTQVSVNGILDDTALISFLKVHVVNNGEVSMDAHLLVNRFDQFCISRCCDEYFLFLIRVIAYENLFELSQDDTRHGDIVLQEVYSMMSDFLLPDARFPLTITPTMLQSIQACIPNQVGKNIFGDVTTQVRGILADPWKQFTSSPYYAAFIADLSAINSAELR